MRLAPVSWIGAFLLAIGIGVFIAGTWWDETRSWAPVDMPISLSPGHVRSDEFKINLESTYDIQIEVERGLNFEGVPCLLGFAFPECSSTPGVLRISWVLSKQGRIISRGVSDEVERMRGGTDTMARGVGSFSAKKGNHYVLDVDILEDGGALNAGHPRLQIFEYGGLAREYESWHISDLVVPSFLLTGIAVLLGSIGQEIAERHEKNALATITAELRSALMVSGVNSARRLGPLLISLGKPSLRRRRPFMARELPVSVPIIGLVCVLTWFVVLIPVWVMSSADHPASVGVLVQISRPGVPVTLRSPDIEPLVVRAKGGGRYQINTRQITLLELPSALDKELRRRVSWVVYFDSDSDVQFTEAAAAIGVIRAAHATVVLLTPVR